jgi:excisionase family DNA binding protein
MEGKQRMNYLTVHEVAALLRVSDLTVRRWVWAGKLPAIRVGRAVRIKQSDVQALSSNTQPAADMSRSRLRPGSPAALLDAARQSAMIVQPKDVEELERLIVEGCERPGETREIVA